MVAPHIPVLIHEVLDATNAQEGDTIIDGTFGAGGYTRALLNHAPCRVIAFDRDPNVVSYVETVRTEYPEHFSFHPYTFSQMRDVLGDNNADAIILDIGVSSMQLDTADRGFSFRFDAALDMRMSDEGTSAADIVNHTEETELARIFWEYGEERASRRVAKAIVKHRTENPILTTTQLRDIIHSVIPKRGKKTDPATKCFQALRIAVNDELGELRKALQEAEHMLVSGGRLVVVTFHSLEDRIVKQFMKDACSTGESTSRHIPTPTDHETIHPVFKAITRKALSASDEELARNPRARSAKLRAVIRTDAPARELLHA